MSLTHQLLQRLQNPRQQCSQLSARFTGLDSPRIQAGRLTILSKSTVLSFTCCGEMKLSTTVVAALRKLVSLSLKAGNCFGPIWK